MTRVLRLPGPLALLIAATIASAHAADLDRPYAAPPVVYAAPPVLGVLDDPAIVVEAPVVLRRLPPPPPIGGGYLYLPGLNGPLGPPAYPLLPYGFGYGY